MKIKFLFLAVLLFVFSYNTVLAQSEGDYVIEEVEEWIQESESLDLDEAETLILDDKNLISIDLSQNQLTQINTAIDNFQSSIDQLGLYIQISDNVVHFEVDENDSASFQMPSASVIKLFILADYYKQVADGEIDPEELYSLEASDIVGGSGALQNLPIGSEHSLETLAQLMIQVSDNTATNVLIERLGGIEAVNDAIHEFGFLQTELNRYMMDQAAIDRGEENLTSAIDVANLFLAVINGFINGPELDNDMLAIMSQHGPVKHARDLDNNRDYYGKTGEYPVEGIENDALMYFVETDEGDIPVIIVSLTQGDDSALQIDAMAEFGSEIERIIKGNN